MTSALDPDLALVARHLERLGGPPLADYKDRCLRRRVAVRMRACGAASLAEYAGVLERSPEEAARLLASLTINVTQFFRNPEVWACLARELAGHRGPLRAWSAGCASGEEAYSLALLAADLPAARPLQVDATDIDAASLERARAGRYPLRVLEGAGPFARLLSPVGEWVEVPEEARRRVRVRHHDMLSDDPPGPPYHLILCRNVIIYFGRDAQERLLARFADALVPGGLLVLGRVETIFGPPRERFAMLHGRERVYRRVP